MCQLILLLFNLLLVLVAARASAEPVTTIRNNGDPANRVDIVVLGDGYTAAQLGKYAADVEAFVSGLFGEEPFRAYRDYFNVHRVDVISSESGADHPERTPPFFRNTALDATYNCSGIQRLICVDTGAVNAVLQRSISPERRDVVIVIVNDAEYGGSGGAVAVASTNALVVELVLHELGHSFGLLADEYIDSQLCDEDLEPIEPAEPNVTKQMNRNSIKWNVGGHPPSGWIELSTDVPTSGASPGVVGLYEGARYCTKLFRPTFDSKMRTLERPFEQVNSEQLVKRIYNWVSPIDSSEPIASTITLPAGSQQLFRIETPRPLTGALAITWKLNGRIVATASQFTLTPSGIASGRHSLEVTVEDPTPFVRDDQANLLIERRTWTVNTDDLRPNTSITSGPTGVVTSTTATFSWSGNDDITPKASLLYAFRLDPMESGFSSFGTRTAVTYNNLANGNYVFLVKTRDGAGNEDLTPASQPFSVELAGLGPQTVINLAPLPLSKSATAIFVFSSTVPGSKFTCSLNGGPATPCRSPKRYARLFNGAHSFEVTAFDSRGLSDPSPASYKWAIDNTLPETTITVSPRAISNQTSTSFHFASSETNSTFQCRLDAGAFAPCTSPKTYVDLLPGRHTFQVAAIDSAGNIDRRPASHRWVIDTAAPETIIRGKPPVLTGNKIAAFSFAANQRGSTFECRLNNGGFQSCPSRHRFSLTPGKYILEVQAMDPAGNRDLSPASYSWTVQ